MKPFLIRNRDGDKLSDKLNEFIDTEGLKEILITTGYWDLKGTACIASKLRTFLEKDGTKLKLIIGAQPVVNGVDLNTEVFNTFIELDDIDYKNKSYQDACELILDYCEAGKIEIRLHEKINDSSFLHAKCYIFKSDSDNSVVITGSGNFTLMGLKHNHELNYIDYDSSHITSPEGYEPWFNCEWEEATEWNEKFKLKLRGSKFYQYIINSKKNNNIETQLKEKNMYEERVNTSETSDSELKDFFISKGCEVIDKRQNGGCLWVVGDEEHLKSILNEMNTTFENVNGTFGKGRATKERRGWYTKDKR